MVGHLAGSFQVHVRVGAANAGHTVWVDGEKHVLQQLPCAAYANPHAQLVLGAGAMISPNILAREIETNLRWRRSRGLPSMRLVIDHRAHTVTVGHVQQEQDTDLAERIGSTSTIAREGIGAAQAARVLRTNYRTITDVLNAWPQIGGVATIADTVGMLRDAAVFGTDILLEGTQGTGLSNTTGFYPYVTSRTTTAAGLAADCGIGPKHLDSVVMVCRTFPIRVAGNSGPFWPDSSEVSWQDLGVDPARERTTVTKKIRRVATFSYEQIKQATFINSATEIVLTFTDYLCPEIRDRAGLISAHEADGFDYVGPMVRNIESVTGVPVVGLGTGPQTMLDRVSDIDRDPVAA